MIVTPGTRLVVATRNRGKLAEYRALFARLAFEVLSLDEAGVDSGLELPEDGETFEHNARSKTRALQRHLGGWALGDDSGLEVDALGGRPGVYSARYAGVDDDHARRDHANLEKLLREIDGVEDAHRGARFVCLVCLVGPGSRELCARGTCAGSIIRVPRGKNGFGYDPVFVPEGFSRTMAELGMPEKNELSHRARAVRALVEILRSAQDFNG